VINYGKMVIEYTMPKILKFDLNHYLPALYDLFSEILSFSLGKKLPLIKKKGRVKRILVPPVKQTSKSIN